MPEINRIDDEDNNTIDKKAHKRLLAGVERLTKSQFIKTPTRNEAAIKRSEFHLVKPTSDIESQFRPVKDAKISTLDLVKVLSQTSKTKNVQIGKELHRNERSKKVLDKPLEKPASDRIKRSIGYEKTKKKLNRWNAVVTRNRAADHLSFPLAQEDSKLDIINGERSDYSNVRLKSELAMEIEALEPTKPIETNDSDGGGGGDDNENSVPLTRAEMIERSKEMRLLRIRESQKSAKARMQNKIKSKKFHKIMKKEKMKEQMKEFELLQKENPEAALRKLEQIEKQRVEERALLRHKNTGTWAKNLQVRAKYDKEVRKDLAEQLQISRELTQKKHDGIDDDDDDDDNNDRDADQLALLEKQDRSDPFNPWLKNSKSTSTAGGDGTTDFVSGYRKYWNERNENEDLVRKYNELISEKQTEEQPIVTKVLKSKINKKPIKNEWLVEDLDIVPAKKIIKKQSNIDNIDDLFDNAEEELQNKIEKKLQSLRNLSDQHANNNNNNKLKNGKLPREKKPPSYADLSFKTTAKHPELDVELGENMASDDETDVANTLKALTTESSSLNNNNNNTKQIDNINPDKFIKIIPKHLNTALPDIEGGFDESDDEMDRGGDKLKKLTIAEAFEDDDIVADFDEQKEEERKKNEPKELDLTLPGWGSWGGCGIDRNKSKSKKLILKFLQPEKRNVENVGNVIIVDQANKKIREHQVSSLPFPFTSVADYEASIRAPIGKEFVPPLAHKLLTKPAVTTQLGTIITPITEDILLKKSHVPKSKTDKQIAKIQQNGSVMKTKQKGFKNK